MPVTADSASSIPGPAAAVLEPGEAAIPSSSKQVQPQPPTEQNVQSMEGTSDSALTPAYQLPTLALGLHPPAGADHSQKATTDHSIFAKAMT